MGSRSQGSGGELDLSWQVGLLANRGRSALGATGYAAAAFDVRADRPVLNTRFGVLPRYRRWLGRSAALDVTTGPVVEVRRNVPTTLLMSTDVAVGWPDDIALSGRVDVSAGHRPAWFVGARLGADQITEALEAEGIALVVWGIIRLITK